MTLLNVTLKSLFNLRQGLSTLSPLVKVCWHSHLPFPGIRSNIFYSSILSLFLSLYTFSRGRDWGIDGKTKQLLLLNFVINPLLFQILFLL